MKKDISFELWSILDSVIRNLEHQKPDSDGLVSTTQDLLISLEGKCLKRLRKYVDGL